jgi:hypothetical protein
MNLTYFFLVLYKTYNVSMNTKFDKDTSAHPPYNPQLWLKAVASDGPDKNQLYVMPITSAREMRVD